MTDGGGPGRIPVGMDSSVWQVCSVDQFMTGTIFKTGQCLKPDSEKMKLAVSCVACSFLPCMRRNLKSVKLEIYKWCKGEAVMY